VDPVALGNFLAPVNAALNFASFVCLVLGYRFIRGGNRDAHRKAMLGAVTASVLFLVFYLTRFALTGTHRFAGEGMARVVYLVILFSHMVLAVVVVPLVLRLLYLAFKERFQEHRRLARWTFPVWMYVSVTGIVVYLMLYRIYGFV
jgi:putative membrane protein